jgi:hypothetical protein
MGIGFRITESLSLTTQIGLAYNGLQHVYGSTRDDRTIDSRLGLLYGRLSPGLTLKPLKFVAIRLGLGMLGSLWTLGEYSITTYNNGAFSKVSYTDRFSRIRNPFLMGPELSLGVDIPLQKSRCLRLSLTGFVTKGGVFRADFNTLFNPRIAEFNLGMAYTFSHKSQ